MLFSADDDHRQPDDFLLDLAIRAVSRARTVSVAEVVRRMKAPPYYPDVWPGEHYRLLAALVEELRPQVVVEVGTYTGLSALTMLTHLQPGGRLITFDVAPWRTFQDNTVLNDADFANGRLEQMIADLGDRATFDQHANLLGTADLMFLDGPKDGVFERRFLDQLATRPLANQPVLVFDDTRVWNMLRIWREIDRPKLDLTSFGHWSGTGLVHWVGE
jgi:predicted O-methyltransferase YrrM